MSPEEKRARRRERDRAAYARDPEKFRMLSRENRLKPGAAKRHKEYAKAWALHNAERVKALRKAQYEKNRGLAIENARVWKKRNPARVLAGQRSRANINRDKNRAARKAWEERNPAAALESFKRYRERNRAKIRARLAVSKEGREKRRVLWANQDAILDIYRQAELMTQTTGRLHVVDHVIPLQGRTVSGLHVETNLRVIEHHENAQKHNSWESPGWQRPGDEAATVAVPRQGSLF
ncbi:MAG: hypothetical protein AB7P44_02715 [Steroidobacteraceae bacterium]